MSQSHWVKRGRVYEPSMRIRTDGDKSHRETTIQNAADRLDCNKTRAVLVSCEVVGDVLDGVEDALAHEDVPPRVRRELADRISTRRVTVEVPESEASVSLD